MTVPRIIHQFWDRPEPPADIAERMRSWPHHHPGWQHRLWNDDSAAAFLAEHHGDEAVLCFRAARLPAMRADLIRLALLSGIGGLYADADMRCRAPVGDLAEARAAIRVEAGKKTGKAKLANNFMLASPGHVLFERAFAQALRNVREGELSLHVSKLTGPLLLTQIWAKQMNAAERAEVRQISELEFRRLVRIGGRLDYMAAGAHWPAEVKRRQIIYFGDDGGADSGRQDMSGDRK